MCATKEMNDEKNSGESNNNDDYDDGASQKWSNKW